MQDPNVGASELGVPDLLGFECRLQRRPPTAGSQVLVNSGPGELEPHDGTFGDLTHEETMTGPQSLCQSA